VPAGWRVGGVDEAGPDRALPRAADRAGRAGERAARHGGRGAARRRRGERDGQGVGAVICRRHRPRRLGRWRLVVAELTYREGVAAGIAQEMERDERVIFLGEDIAAAGGVFKATVGLLERFGPKPVRDTPLPEQAILRAAMGAAR